VFEDIGIENAVQRVPFYLAEINLFRVSDDDLRIMITRQGSIVRAQLDANEPFEPQGSEQPACASCRATDF